MNRWINVHDRLPEEDELVLAAVSGRYENVEWVDAYLLARLYPEEGWMLEEYPEAENFRITWWMKLPDDLPDADVVQTNADRIRSMSNEKLLERLVTFCDCSYSCSGCLIEHECPVDDDKDTTVREDIENWLKAPCKED